MTERSDQTIRLLQNGQADLAERVEKVEGHLARLVEVVTTQLQQANPPDADPDTDGHHDEEVPLEDWVANLSEQYYLDAALTGWEDNTAMRAELEALRVAAKVAFSDTPGTWDQLSWHDHLARILARFDDQHSGPRRRAKEAGQHKAIHSRGPTDQEPWEVLRP